jgi:hypothetical protein
MDGFMKHIGPVLIVIMMLTGCASLFPTTKNYDKLLDDWIGKPMDNLAKSWGPPGSSYKLSNGETVIEYYKSHNVQYDASYFNAKNENIQVETLWCRTIFVVDKNGIITSWKHTGNDCVAYPQK